SGVLKNLGVRIVPPLAPRAGSPTARVLVIPTSGLERSPAAGLHESALRAEVLIDPSHQPHRHLAIHTRSVLDAASDGVDARLGGGVHAANWSDPDLDSHERESLSALTLSQSTRQSIGSSTP